MLVVEIWLNFMGKTNPNKLKDESHEIVKLICCNNGFLCYLGIISGLFHSCLW